MTYRVAFDLDGTLFNHNGRVNWEDPGSVAHGTSPEGSRCWLVTDLHNCKWRIDFVTNRSETLRNVTQMQLHAAFYWFKPSMLHMRDPLLGWEEGFQHKVGTLRMLGTGVYVGDQESDCDAARVAGWGFLQADQFPRSIDLLPLLHPMAQPLTGVI